MRPPFLLVRPENKGLVRNTASNSVLKRSVIKIFDLSPGYLPAYNCIKPTQSVADTRVVCQIDHGDLPETLDG